jgi:hypothetical protein
VHRLSDSELWQPVIIERRRAVRTPPAIPPCTTTRLQSPRASEQVHPTAHSSQPVYSLAHAGDGPGPPGAVKRP